MDSTITGIGRGPGNALTEELILEINQGKFRKKNNLNLVPLIQIINKHFLPIKKEIFMGFKYLLLFSWKILNSSLLYSSNA